MKDAGNQPAEPVYPHFAVFGARDPIRDLRWADPIDCLREVQVRADRDWGIKLPSPFVLCGRDPDGKVYMVGNFYLDESGAVVMPREKCSYKPKGEPMKHDTTKQAKRGGPCPRA